LLDRVDKAAGVPAFSRLKEHGKQNCNGRGGCDSDPPEQAAATSIGHRDLLFFVASWDSRRFFRGTVSLRVTIRLNPAISSGADAAGLMLMHSPRTCLDVRRLR